MKAYKTKYDRLFDFFGIKRTQVGTHEMTIRLVAANKLATSLEEGIQRMSNILQKYKETGADEHPFVKACQEWCVFAQSELTSWRNENDKR